MPPDDFEGANFAYDKWHIERAVLLTPKKAILARAENDEYASDVFYPENTMRALDGKADGKGQRFALEFFIRFPSGEAEPATFKVTFLDTKKKERHTERISAQVNV